MILKGEAMSRVLVIGDTHEPVARKGYLEFCLDMREAWRCDTVVHIGDVVDWQAVSFHAAHPECPGPADEYELAFEKVQKWVKSFPKLTVTIGNHDERPGRKMKDSAVPARFLRNYEEIWDTPKWKWLDSVEIDGVRYTHGYGYGGKYHAANIRNARHQSVVCGHCHSVGLVHWDQSQRERIFGMNVGCGIDDRAFQFAYSKHNEKRSFLGCGVVIDQIPYLEPMPCGRGEKYHDSKF